MAAEDRRGSRINTERFPKRAPKAQASRGSRECFPLGSFLDFISPKSPFLVFWVIQTGYWPDFKLESFNLIKILYIYLFKIWPISEIGSTLKFPSFKQLRIVFKPLGNISRHLIFGKVHIVFGNFSKIFGNRPDVSGNLGYDKVKIFLRIWPSKSWQAGIIGTLIVRKTVSESSR